jgi:hypothetical protein
MRLSRSDWDYVLHHSDSFTGRTWLFDRLRQFLSVAPHGRFILVGQPGTGKTAIAAQLLRASFGPVTAHPMGEAKPVASGPIPSGSIHTAYLCRSGQVDILDCAQRLSEQLSDSVPGFHEMFLTTLAPQIKVGEVHVQTGDLADGASVSGVRINLGALGFGRAFTEGITLPLRRLRDKGFTERVVILVDALDEALVFDSTRELVHLVAGIQQAHVIVTTRPDRTVLGLVENQAEIVDLLRDAPSDANVNDIRDYVSNRLKNVRDPDAKKILSDRIAAAAEGNFLYAFHVLGSIYEDGSRKEYTPEDALRVELPMGGLPGVYRVFLQQRPMAWTGQYYPVLAPITVAQGEGLHAEQLVPIASRIQDGFTRTKVRQVTRSVFQFLEGKLPDGPFRPYHKSFADFLQDPMENPDFVIDSSEAHRAIVETFWDMPRSEWDTYAWRHLLTHAYYAGKERCSFHLLFKLAAADYLGEKLEIFNRLDWVSDDYELLFRACGTREIGRLAGYALSRSKLADHASVRDVPALLRLQLAALDRDQIARAAHELLSSAELILDPLNKASKFLDLYQYCPEFLWKSHEREAILDSAWKLLQQIPGSRGKDDVLARLVTVVSVRRLDRLEWLEGLIGSVKFDDRRSDIWARLAHGFLHWGDEAGAARCLGKALQYLPFTLTFSVREFFTVCDGLQLPDKLHEVHERALAVLAQAVGQDTQAELLAISAGLLARAGWEAQALDQIDRAFSIFARSQQDEWNRALLISKVADCLGQFSSPESISRLWKRFTIIIQSFSGASRTRLSSRLAVGRSAHALRGVIDPGTALEDVSGLGIFELGDYGCRAELQTLLKACVESKSLSALLSLRSTLAQMEPVRDRARIAGGLMVALNSLAGC